MTQAHTKHLLALTAATAICLAGQALAQAPHAATLYSAFKGGKKSFLSEYDKHLSALGWKVRKFENIALPKLATELPTIDVLIGCSVYNYENVQDFAAVKEPLLRWLNEGGVALFTDASYASSLGKGVCRWGSRFALTHALASAHTKPSKHTRVVRAAEGCPLAAVPHDLAQLATEHGHWAHFSACAAEWQPVLMDSDDRPVLVCQQVGRGLLAVTNLSCMNRVSAQRLGPALLENLWTHACVRRAGMELHGLTLGPALPGQHSCSAKLSNRTDRKRPLRVLLHITTPDGETREAASSAIVGAQVDAALSIRYEIKARGLHQAAVSLSADDAAKPFYTMKKTLDVPAWITLDTVDRWLYPDRGEVRASVAICPDPDVDLKDAEMVARIVARGKVLVSKTWPRPQPAQDVALPVAGLPRGKANLEVLVRSRGRDLAKAELDIHLCPQPKVWIKADRQCVVDGKPFFPIGMYFVCWYLTQDQIIDGLRDLAHRGFNTAHVGTTRKHDFQAIADEAQRLGMRLIVEFGTPREETVRRWKTHPAILAWNPGDEPDGRGVPPQVMQQRREAFKALDPDHPSYLTLCVPSTYGKYARFTDVLSIDPYPVRGASPDLSRVATSVEQAQAAMDRQRPIWVVPQAFGYESKPNSWRVPTPAQERCMTYQALVHGARGLVYYTYLDGSFDLTKAPALTEELTRLAHEVAVLAPMLVAPGDGRVLRLGEGGCIHVLVKKGRGRDYAIAVNVSEKPLKAVQIPFDANADSVEVLFENRRLDPHEGTVQDDFSGHGTHAYVGEGK